MKSNLKFAFVTALLLGAFSANSAFACGFLACVAEAVDPGHADVYRALDKANGDHGHPAEAAAAAVLESL